MMKIWAAVVRQHGEGCDYSIRCGEKMIPLSSTNFDDAVDEIKTKLETEYGMWPGSEDRDPKTIAIVSIEGFVDLEEWEAERDEAEKEEEEEVEADHARNVRYQEYLALKAEFE